MNTKLKSYIDRVAGQTIDRWPYFWWGVGLMALKYNLDRIIAWTGFHRMWYFWNYIKPNDYASINAVPISEQSFYYLLLLSSLPFVAVGLILTVWRLRSAKLPLALSVLFFVPILNLIFFIILSMIPPGQTLPVAETRSHWTLWLPTSKAGSALVSVIVVSLLGAAIAVFSTQGLSNYGWGLFVALPFVMGLISVLIYAGPSKRSFGSCMAVALLPVVFTGMLLLVMAVEGIICLAMAAPVALMLAFLGGVVGYLIVQKCPVGMNPASMMLLLFSVPFIMGMEKQADDPPPLFSVTTSVVINAPIERVWSSVISFSPIPDKRDWILHTGIAYPIRAKIDGHGVGAIRHCIFSTGEFVEPINVWDEPHLLRFAVIRQPEPMQELSPYRHLKTPHLDNYLQSQKGEFRLTTLSNGMTMLEGTTWYTDRIWPATYWKLWSDIMIHHIHLRVLNHIKNLSEQLG